MATHGGQATPTIKPVWPFIVLATLAIPTAGFVTESIYYLEFGYFMGPAHLMAVFTDGGSYPARLVGLLVGLVLFIGAIYLAAKRSQANRRPPGATNIGPIGHTTEGDPIYPVVGYTADGKPVTANRAVGVQQHVSGTNGLAIASLITAFFVPLVPIILGHLARSQIRRTGQDGAGLALAGLIIGYSYLIANIAVAVLFIVASRGGF